MTLREAGEGAEGETGAKIKQHLGEAQPQNVGGDKPGTREPADDHNIACSLDRPGKASEGGNSSKFQKRPAQRSIPLGSRRCSPRAMLPIELAQDNPS